MHWGQGEEDTSGLSLERVPWTPANVLQSPLCFVVLSWSLCFVLLPGGISFLLLCCGLLVPCSSSRPAQPSIAHWGGCWDQLGNFGIYFGA